MEQYEPQRVWRSQARINGSDQGAGGVKETDVRTIKIQWLSDEHDCETCGNSYAEGARVFIDNEVLEFTPYASCFGGDSWYVEDIYKEIINYLGYEIEVIE